MILDKINLIIALEFKIKPEQVNQKMRLVEDLGADSLRKVECLMKLEEAFSIEIPDSEARELITIGDIINYVERKTGALSKER